MTTFLACPISGCVPADNGTNTTPANNVVPVVSDAVGASSGIIASASSTAVNVTTPANFPKGTWFTIPTRTEKFYVSSAGGTNPLTVIRAADYVGGVPVQSGNPSAAIALNDVILTGLDVNGQPSHCPVCGTALVTVDPAKVTSLTTVVAGSQHPADVDETYVTQADSTLAQTGTSNTPSGGYGPRISHTFSVSGGTVSRGTSTVTPETINGTVGP